MSTRISPARWLVRIVCVGAAATLGLSSTAINVVGAAPAVTSGFAGLRQGSQGDEVRQLQKALIAAGISVPGGADGVFGPATKNALLSFQRARGLSATGSVDEATSKALATTSGSGSGTSGYLDLREGSTGDAVKTVQKKLIAGGVYLAKGADGVWGSSTTRAISQFQKWNGIEVTGSLNVATLKRLGLSGTTSATPTPTTPPATSASTYVGLKVGSQGTLVKELQQALAKTGLVIRGGADGRFGAATESALKAFQRVNGLSQTGVVTERVVTLLKLGTTPTTTAPPSTTPTNSYVGLKSGSRGALVKELQSALISLGYSLLGGADGSFGPATTTVLKSVQRANGLPQTGVVSQEIVKLLGLGTGTVKPIVNPTPSSAGVKLERFPVQGNCAFGDTWHAPRSGGRLHEGVDIIAAEGKLLYAVVDGTVSKLYWDQPGALSGNGLRIQQPNGTYFTYLHLLGFAPGIKVGTKVKAGDVIGFVGNTGSSATPHLHFEIHPYGGGAVNPYPFVKALNDCSNTKAQYQGTFT